MFVVLGGSLDLIKCLTKHLTEDEIINQEVHDCGALHFQ